MQTSSPVFAVIGRRRATRELQKVLDECTESVATIELDHGSFVAGDSRGVILQEDSTVLNIWHILIVGPVILSPPMLNL